MRPVRPFALLLACALLASAETPLSFRDADSVFQERLATYVTVRDQLAQLAELPREPTDLRSAAAQRERLGAALRALRRDVKQGVIFGGVVGTGFRRVSSIAMDAPGVRHWVVDRALGALLTEHARVNEPLPRGIDHDVHTLLLHALPALPRGLEYRVLHYDLILWDINADFVVDVLPGAFFVETS